MTQERRVRLGSGEYLALVRRGWKTDRYDAHMRWVWMVRKNK